MSVALFSGTPPNDGRVHENPSVVGFDTLSGSAPDWISITPTTGTFCQNDIVATLNVMGSAFPTCYKLTIISSSKGLMYSCQTMASGSCSISPTNGGQFVDGASVLFRDFEDVQLDAGRIRRVRGGRPLLDGTAEAVSIPRLPSTLGTRWCRASDGVDASVRDGDGRGPRRRVAGGIGAAHGDGVDAAAAIARPFRPHVHRARSGDLPIGLGAPVAIRVRWLVARDARDRADRRSAAVGGRGRHGHRHHLVIRRHELRRRCRHA